MIVNDFGYHPKEVFVTGLSRFDTLFAEDVEWKRQILIIPTWRDWIVNDEAFFESEYYERYKRLIHHEQLQKMAKRYNLEIVFCYIQICKGTQTILNTHQFELLIKVKWMFNIS